LSIRRFLRRPAAVATAAAITIGVGTAIAPSASASQSITVLITSSPSASALQSIAPAFTKQTGIHVKFVEVPYQAITTKLLLANKSGSIPYDVAQVDSPMMAPLVAAGALTPMKSFFAKYKEYKSTDFPQKVTQYTEYRGVPYTLPLSTEPYTVFYRKDIYAKLGLKPATTWAQFASNAAACKKAGYYGSDLSYSSTDAVYEWATILYSLGGRMLNSDNTKATITTPVAMQATKIYNSLIPYTPSGAINGGEVDAISIFGEQNVCTMIEGTGNWESIYSPKNSKVYGKLAMSPIPQGPTVLFGWLIGLPTKSPNPTGGAEFLAYALSPAHVSTFVSDGAPPPGRTSLLSSPKITSELPYMPVLLKTESGALHFPYIPQMPEVLIDISEQLNSIATNGESAQQGLSKAQSQVDSVLG
jgi:ABC-type glycerol-3-phosphate transport system substrate-binding protein